MRPRRGGGKPRWARGGDAYTHTWMGFTAMTQPPQLSLLMHRCAHGWNHNQNLRGFLKNKSERHLCEAMQDCNYQDSSRVLPPMEYDAPPI